MIKPTIGRVVWFWWSASLAENKNEQPKTALVTYVHNDELVNLALFDASGDHSPRCIVPLYQGEGPRPKGPHCEWMPYQKGAAVRHEVDVVALATRVLELEAQLKATANMMVEALKPKGGGAINTPIPPPPAQMGQ